MGGDGRGGEGMWAAIGAGAKVGREKILVSKRERVKKVVSGTSFCPDHRK